jgi:hypothetical protein
MAGLLLTLLLAGGAPRPLTPESILRAIRARGDIAVLADLKGDTDTWDRLMNQIAGGQPAWLDVADRLLGVADDDEATDLESAVGAALTRAPEVVLQSADSGGEIALTWVCSETDSLAKDSGYEARIAMLAERERAVRAVKAPGLTKKREACLKGLQKARVDLERELRAATEKIG